MKIRCIRGQNLTSLVSATPWEVNLVKAPLADAGLFAITGPTGAGKSTILDAMCLALYGQTPRMRGGGRATISAGIDALGLNDARNLLSRGAGSGFAEVEFEGRDRGVYRARWSVARARGKSDGRLQTVEMEMEDLGGGKLLAAKKSEVQELLIEKIGLNYDEFCRSVLLAQGEFAAFLDANANDRAALLEKITGTEIYSLISVAAFERAKAEEQRLASLKSRMEGLTLLSEPDRAALLEEISRLRGEIGALDARREELRSAQRWYSSLAALAAQHADALTRRDRAAEAAAAGAPIRQELTLIELAEPLRGVRQRRNDARDEAARLHSQLEATAVERDAGRVELERGRDALARAELGVTQASGALAGASEELKEARGLDVSLGEARKNLDVQSKRCEEARKAFESSAARLSELEGGVRAVRSREEAAVAWLDERHGWTPLAEAWPRVEFQLKEAVAAANERRGADSEFRRLIARESSLREADRAAKAALGQANVAYVAAAGDLRTLEDSVVPEHRAALEGLLDQTRELQGLFKDLAALTSLAETSSREIQELETRVGEIGVDLAAVSAELSEAETAIPLLRGDLDKARRARELAGLVRKYEADRHLLDDGVACPLCGSPEHPLGNVHPPDDAELEALGAAVDQAEKKATGAASRAAVLERRRIDLGQRHEETSATLARKRDLLEGYVSQWNEKTAPLGDWAGAKASEAGVRCRSEQDRLAAEARRLIGLLAEQSARVQAVAQARKIQEAARFNLEDRRESAAKAELALTRAEQELQAAAGKLSGLDAAIRERRESLAGSLDEGLLAALDSDAARALATCEERVNGWRGFTQTRETARAELAGLLPKLATARGLANEHQDARERERATLTQALQVCDTLEGARRRLLGGLPADAVEARLRIALKSAEKVLTDERRTCEDLALREAALSSRHSSLSQQHATATATLGEREADLGEATTSAGLHPGQRDRLLGIPPGQVVEWRERLARDAETLRGAETVLTERAARLDAHRQTNAPGITEEEAASAIADLEASRAVLDARRSEQDGRLAIDNAARGKSAALLPEVTAQGHVRARWASISELIGSAKGEKFRRYVQHLTLEMLLDLANGHLRDLARRYRLQAIPGAEMEFLIVDRDMGDELRPLRSLSGGESFLVALGLALGLSSLASHRTPVETLFIDEGFGSLDPASLELALSALDALQAGGRQIGVISHVPAMHERIAAQVRVTPLGGGRSRLEVEG